MATREENLKKINAELEKLDDDELEKVAGGLMPQNGIRDTWNHWDCIDKPNTDNDQNTPANQLGVKKAIKWD